jgi:hypothetical protein
MPACPSTTYSDARGKRDSLAPVRVRCIRPRANVLRGELRSERRMLAAIARLDRSAESGWAVLGGRAGSMLIR